MEEDNGNGNENGKLDVEAFAKTLKKHKQFIVKFALKEQVFSPRIHDDKIAFSIAKNKELAKELSLVASGFQCQRCRSIERLSWHHLVYRKSKEYMPFNRYLVSRYYWSNIIVLCWKCHKEYHDIIDKGKSEMETDIDKNLIEKLKKKYYV